MGFSPEGGGGMVPNRASYDAPEEADGGAHFVVLDKLEFVSLKNTFVVFLLHRNNPGNSDK